MRQTQLLTRFRSFKFISFAIFAFFLFASLTDSSFTRALAPAVEAKTIIDDNFIPPDIPTSGDRDLDAVIYQAGLDTGVDPRLLHAVIQQESNYKATSFSVRGAQGLMQMMPATARRFNCRDTSDPKENISAGARYLRYLLERFDGDVSLALAGYNAGEGSVEKYDGVPPFGETQTYVRTVTTRYGKTFHPLLTPEEARVEFRLLPEISQK